MIAVASLPYDVATKDRERRELIISGVFFCDVE